MNVDDISKALIDPSELCEGCPYSGEPNGCNRGGGACAAWNLAQDAADMIQDLRNELCIKCGRSGEAHNGACDGCRWKGDEQ